MPFKPKLKFTKLYFPGLISLVCLPLLFVVNMIWTGVFEKQYVMEINAFSKNEVIRDQKVMGFLKDLLNSKAEHDFELDKSNVVNVIEAIHKIPGKPINSNSTELLLKISFTPKTSYGDIVKVFDACNQLDDRLPRLYLANIFYIYKLKPMINNKSELHPPYIFYDEIGEDKPPLSITERIGKWLIGVKSPEFLCLFALLILMYGLHFSGKGKLRIPNYRSSIKI